MLAHVYTIAAELDTFGLQAESLLHGGFTLQQDAPAGSYHPMPGQALGLAGVQRPNHLARSAWVSRRSRHSSVGAHSPTRNPSHDGQESLEHGFTCT